jgi:hypothetical protein
MAEQVPEAIRRFIDATNAGDSETFAAAFTEDAYLNDWGKEFHGQSGVRSWDRTDNIGRQAHFEVLDVKAVHAPTSYIVRVKVTGNGFNGTSPLAFTLRDDRIEALRIT